MNERAEKEIMNLCKTHEGVSPELLRRAMLFAYIDAGKQISASLHSVIISQAQIDAVIRDVEQMSGEPI